MNSTKTFGIVPVVMLLLLSVGLANHVMILPLLLDAARRDAWLCVPAALLLVLPWTALPLFGILRKLNGVRIDDWLRQRLPRAVVWTVMAIMLLIQLYISYTTLIQTVHWTAATYLPRTPAIAVCIVLVALCGYAASQGLRTIAYVSCVLLPAVVLFGDFVMSANLPRKDYSFLLPMLENGARPVIEGALFSVSSFVELYVLMMLQHHFRKPIKRWHLVLLVLMLALLTVGPTAGAIVAYGPDEAEKLLYPAFAQWRLVVIGKYVEHVDFFAVFQWLSGALIRISVPLYLLLEFGPVRARNRKRIMLAFVCAAFVFGAYFSLQNLSFTTLMIVRYFRIVWLIVIVLVMLLWLATFMNKRKEAEGS